MESDDAMNSFRYMRLLARNAEGLSIWYPTDVGKVGDVGYIHQGYFNKLFNAFDDAPTPLLSINRSARSTVRDVRSNKHFAWKAVEKGSYHAGAEVPASDIVSLGFDLSKEHAGAAFLVPGGGSRYVERCLEARRLLKYLLEHEARIIQMFPDDPWDECTLMILQSTIHAISWYRGLSRESAGGFQGEIGFQVPLTGIPVLRLEAGKQQAVWNGWLIDSGPSTESTSGQARIGWRSTTQSETTQPETYCLIVKPIIVRRRDRLMHRLRLLLSSSASESARQRPPGPDNSRSPGPDNSHSPNSGQSGPASSGASASGQAQGPSDDMTLQSQDELLISEESDPPNELEQLLDLVLESWKDLNAVAGSWDLLYGLPEHPTIDDLRKIEYQLEIQDTESSDRVAIMIPHPSQTSGPFYESEMELVLEGPGVEDTMDNDNKVVGAGNPSPSGSDLDWSSADKIADREARITYLYETGPASGVHRGSGRPLESRPIKTITKILSTRRVKDTSSERNKRIIRDENDEEE